MRKEQEASKVGEGEKGREARNVEGKGDKVAKGRETRGRRKEGIRVGVGAAPAETPLAGILIDRDLGGRSLGLTRGRSSSMEGRERARGEVMRGMGDDAVCSDKFREGMKGLECMEPTCRCQETHFGGKEQ